ncbi:hypothetical protein [Sulfurimonas sp.]|uniref:hypothetical protein n=1 Tax=Sulfurimonas sp. TaxID=2022749 RepID=UPI002AAF355C|nr:hypothetical protein [Sulfurimonas sp.]
MKIKLIKVGKTPLDFDIKSNEMTFKGYLEYHANRLILLDAKVNGSLGVQCSQCGDEFKLSLNEDIKFYLCDGAYDDSDNIALDVVESFDSQVDLEELLNSEIELIKSDYHSCQDCK